MKQHHHPTSTHGLKTPPEHKIVTLKIQVNTKYRKLPLLPQATFYTKCPAYFFTTLWNDSHTVKPLRNFPTFENAEKNHVYTHCRVTILPTNPKKGNPPVWLSCLSMAALGPSHCSPACPFAPWPSGLLTLPSY